MTTSTALLTDKNAVIYGGGGGIGREVAVTFAREGARVFLAGRTRTTLEESARAVEAAGGTAHVAVVDALDPEAVAAHVHAVVDQAGTLDVSFNLVTRGDVQGTPLLEMAVDDFMAPITTGARANFITAQAAARQMVTQGSGVIMMLTSGSGTVQRPSPAFNMGGTGPADAAVETYLRYLAAEVGPKGVRVLGIWTAGVFYPDFMSQLSLLPEGPTVQQTAEAAAFLASDRAGGSTNMMFNASSGVCSA